MREGSLGAFRKLRFKNKLWLQSNRVEMKVKKQKRNCYRGWDVMGRDDAKVKRNGMIRLSASQMHSRKNRENRTTRTTGA
jgi:hypothetical protein